jgi:KaiC/GvpD/RAD55 family RecA-like ATPase
VTNTLPPREFSFDILKGILLTPLTTGLNMAIIGPPGVGKSTLCQALLKEACRTGTRCLYAITSNPIGVLRDQLRNQGIPLQGKTDQILYVDMYSWLLGERSTERFQIDNASDMAALSVILSTAAETIGDKAFVVFDSPSTLLAYNTEELMVRFIKSHLARMKKHENVGAYAFETGIHSNSFYNEVRSSFDSVIEMKLEEMDGELRRFLRVYSYRGGHETKWFRFLIGRDRSVKIY